MERENADLRRILGNVLDDGVQDCDGTNPNPDIDPRSWCACSTARARRVLAGEPEWPA